MKKTKNIEKIIDNQYYQLNGKGGLNDTVEKSFNVRENLTWVRLSPKKVKPFFEKYIPEIPDFISDSLSAHETRPRVLVYQNGLLGTFRGVNLHNKLEPEDMVSVRIWIQDNLIITVQRRNLFSTNEILQDLQQGTGPSNIAEFLEMLLTALIDKASEVIATLDNTLDDIEDQIAINLKQIDRTNLNAIRRRIIILRRHLVPQRDAINRIPIDKLTWLNETNLVHFREISDSCTRAVEDLNAEHERATVIHEELFALVQENMNQRMYILSIVAIVFMPLSFITGLLGINVGGIPGTSYRYAFLIVCIMILVIFLCQFIYFKIKKWL